MTDRDQAVPQRVSDDQLKQAVCHLLYNEDRERDYPVYETQDDRGLDEHEYIAFAQDLLAMLSTPTLNAAAPAEPLEDDPGYGGRYGLQRRPVSGVEAASQQTQAHSGVREAQELRDMLQQCRDWLYSGYHFSHSATSAAVMAALPNIDAKIAALAAQPSCGQKSDADIAREHSLVLIRNAVVLSIAFLGRDAGSARSEYTTPQIIKILANADTETRRLLAELRSPAESEGLSKEDEREIAGIVGQAAFGAAPWTEPSTLCYRILTAILAKFDVRRRNV